MRHFWISGILILFTPFFAPGLFAQSSVDFLLHDLESFKHDRQVLNDKMWDNFMTRTQEASSSSDAAMALYEEATAPPPDANTTDTPDKPARKNRSRPDINSYEHPSERQKQQEAENAAKAQQAAILQAHCAMLRFAAQFAFKPETPHLQETWQGWLKSAAVAFPQLGFQDMNKNPERAKTDAKDLEISKIEMSKSPIAAYLGLKYWPEVDQAKWSVKKLPAVFFKEILTPMRTANNPDILTTWDTYILMRQADNEETERWTTVDLPQCQFSRSVDDFNLKPSVPKLETIIAIVKANPSHPNADDMIKQTEQLVQQMKGGGGTSTPVTLPGTSTIVETKAPLPDSPANTPVVPVPTTSTPSATPTTTPTPGTATTTPDTPAQR